MNAMPIYIYVNLKIKAKFKKIYSITEHGTFTVNAKTITDDYANLTDENFILANRYTKITGIIGGNLDSIKVLVTWLYLKRDNYWNAPHR